jgi:16S rRNA (guanine966-N2)-methyltransferase
VRVIAGSLKGRRLKAPTWDGLRPTSDKLRETLFNIVAPRVAGARVLDGFAGTGALGIEALSRGAAEVTFVERDRRAQALIEENLAHCGVQNGCVIIREDVAHALNAFRGRPPFDLILLDPPYDQCHDAVIALAGNVLSPGGLLIVEHARRQQTPAAAGSVTRTRQVVSGDSALSFYTCVP